MKNLTLEHIAQACGGIYRGPADRREFCVTDITTDSRKVSEGCLFVAICGARVDGHDFIPAIMEKGAAAAISEKDLGETDYPYIQVKSSLQAVKDIAEYYLAGLQIPVVGIVGSVGKTSTKEMVASVLAQKYNVLKTEGNFNNELGVPLTIFRLREEHEIAVLEMGISDFGEMHRLAKIVRPNAVIMTNIGWCHLENLKDRDGILKAKSEVFDYLEAGDHVLMNGDDDKLAPIKDVKGVVPVKFGLDQNNEIWADDVSNQGLRGISCRIHTPAGDFQAEVPMPGNHTAYNALAGTAVGLKYGLTLEEIAAGLAAVKPLNGRFNLIETGKYTLIDDCYNANPVSMKASLEVLQNGLTRKVAVLGDMGELGANEVELHRGVGAFAAGLRIDAVYTVGTLTKSLAEAVKSGNPAKEVKSYDTVEAFLKEAGDLLHDGDTILVKASHFMKFEQIVAALQ